MMQKITAILLILAFVAMFAVLSGCTSRTVTTPSGWSYRSVRLFTDTAIEEMTYDPTTGAFKIAGVKSDQSKLIDLATELAKP